MFNNNAMNEAYDLLVSAVSAMAYLEYYGCNDTEEYGILKEQVKRAREVMIDCGVSQPILDAIEDAADYYPQEDGGTSSKYYEGILEFLLHRAHEEVKAAA